MSLLGSPYHFFSFMAAYASLIHTQRPVHNAKEPAIRQGDVTDHAEEY